MEEKAFGGLRGGVGWLAQSPSNDFGAMILCNFGVTNTALEALDGFR